MIDAKHESRYNYTELLYLIEEAFFMGAFFDWLLEHAGVVGTPGVGFGGCGEGYFRLTAFGDAEKTRIAAQRIKEAVLSLSK